MLNAIAKLQESYPGWEGTKALTLLVCHPNEAIPAAILERCLNQGISPREAQTSLFRLAPIRMTDDKTLRAVKNRLNTLMNVEASSRSLEVEASSRSLKVEASSRSLKVEASCRSLKVEASSRSLINKRQDDASTSEIAALTAYLKETTLPTGKIKCFGDDDTKAYRRLWAAINRLLKKAEADGHSEAVAIIKANLKQGKMFRWSSPFL